MKFGLIILTFLNEPQKVGRSGRCVKYRKAKSNYINGKMNVANNH